MSTSLKEKLKNAEKIIANLRKENALIIKVMGQCVYRGHKIDDVYDRLEAHQETVKAVEKCQKAIQSLEKRIDKLDRTINTIQDFELEQVS